MGPLRVRYLDGSGLRVAYAVRARTAVARNRVRRRLRAVFRERAETLRPGAYLVTAGDDVLDAGFDTLREATDQLARLVSR